MSFETVAVHRELHPELERHRTAFRAIQSQVRDWAAELSDEQALWRPEPHRWSIADCIEHLNQVDGRVAKGMARAIERGREERLLAPPHAKEFKHGWFGNWAVRRTEPPVTFRLKAPGTYKPKPDLEQSPGEIFQRFDEIQEQLVNRVEEAQGLDLARIKMPSPLTRLIQFSLGQWFAFVAAHDRRHLWQAEQVRGAEGFPG